MTQGYKPTARHATRKDRCFCRLSSSRWLATRPHRILRDEADLDVWLAEVGQAVLAKLKDGPVQL